jgi:ABC-2 type transport system permease protein
VVDGVRAVFRGEMGSSDSLTGMALTVALVAIGVAFGARVFRKESA